MLNQLNIQTLVGNSRDCSLQLKIIFSGILCDFVANNEWERSSGGRATPF